MDAGAVEVSSGAEGLRQRRQGFNRNSRTTRGRQQVGESSVITFQATFVLGKVAALVRFGQYATDLGRQTQGVRHCLKREVSVRRSDSLSDATRRAPRHDSRFLSPKSRAIHKSPRLP